MHAICIHIDSTRRPIKSQERKRGRETGSVSWLCSSLAHFHDPSYRLSSLSTYLPIVARSLRCGHWLARWTLFRSSFSIFAWRNNPSLRALVDFPLETETRRLIRLHRQPGVRVLAAHVRRIPVRQSAARAGSPRPQNR